MKLLVILLSLAIIFTCSSCSCGCDKKGPEIRNEKQAISVKAKSTQSAKAPKSTANQDNQSSDCGCGD